MKNNDRFPKLFVWIYGVLFVLATFPNVFLGGSRGLFDHAQLSWQDLMVRRSEGVLKAGDPRLILVAVDADTGKKFGFPLPRPVYARMLDRLKALGARVVVFDVMFFEPREGDAELAAATRRFGRVVHLFAQDVQPTAKGAVTTTSLPVPPLLKATKYIGHPNIDDLIDDDGHIRRFSLFRVGTPDPLRDKFSAVALEAMTLSADQDKTVEQVRDAYGEDVMNLNFRLPRDWMLHEKRDTVRKILNPDVVTSPYRRISLVDLLSGDLTPEQAQALKGAIVMVGSTALGYYDHYPTPFLETAPGAEFHLNVIDNLLHHDPMGTQGGAAALLLVIAAFVLTYFLQRLPPTQSAIAAAATLIGWCAYAVMRFRAGYIVLFVAPAAAFLSSYLVLVVKRVMDESRERAKTKGLFGQFVSPEVVEKLVADPSQVKLGGEKRDMTVFFLDIAHFTNISEKMDPEALILFLNKYLSRLSHVIHEHHGTIDKYIGDCIMAFWNAPLDNPDHRADAILAALECQDAIKDLNKQLDPSIPEVPAVRIGINSGVVTVGLTGSDKKLQYTVIGDEVNLASRLEGANKFFGSKIIVSESAYQGVSGRVAARLLGQVRVVGKETPIRIYEPLGEKGKLDGAWTKALPLYEKGVADFDAKKYADALDSFKKFSELLPEDGPGQLYLRLCQEYSVLPPDDTWKGVFNLTAK